MAKFASYTVRWFGKMEDIDQKAWDALALPISTPFLEWDFLNLLEVSQSIVRHRGWQPMHLTVFADKKLVAAAPLYIKTSGIGEFVPDDHWHAVANLFKIKFYPKLVGMSPVTPLSGYRFLICPHEDEKTLTAMMFSAIDRLCKKHGLSGCHLLFTDPAWIYPEKASFFSLMHQAFVWENKTYGNFDDYLKTFNTNQRRNIKKERSRLLENGFFINFFSADAIPTDFPQNMYNFYASTNDKHGLFSCKFLTEAFFQGLYDFYRHRMMVTAAYSTSDPLTPRAMAMFLYKKDRLYGRYWGSLDPKNTLLFNLCYYTPVEWAIEKEIRWFDPGMGGWHKIRRGSKVVPSYSCHKFYDTRLQLILKQQALEINRLELAQIEHCNAKSPIIL